MAKVSPPAWAKGAVPTPAGWRDPRTNELLKAQKLSQAQINAYLGVEEKVTPPAPAPKPAPETSPLDSMTKVQLEELGREHGVELDRRKSKAILVAQMKEILS
jgi:hypothetical protein